MEHMDFEQITARPAYMGERGRKRPLVSWPDSEATLRGDAGKPRKLRSLVARPTTSSCSCPFAFGPIGGFLLPAGMPAADGELWACRWWLHVTRHWQQPSDLSSFFTHQATWASRATCRVHAALPRRRGPEGEKSLDSGELWCAPAGLGNSPSSGPYRIPFHVVRQLWC